MVAVLNAGAKGSNKKRREEGDKPIPTTFTKLKLNPPTGDTIPYVKVDLITSILAITYIPHVGDRLTTSDSGYYINMFPWVPWQRGKPITCANVCDGSNAEALTAKQKKLRPELKPAGSLSRDDYTLIKKQHDHRCKCLTDMGFNVGQIMNPSF